MKDKLFLAGVLGIVLVFGVVLVGCEKDEGDSNPFEGTWNYSVNGQIQESYTFSGSTYKKKTISNSSLIVTEEGTYSTASGNITFQPTKKLSSSTGNLEVVSGTNASPDVKTYSFSGASLVIGTDTLNK